MQLSGERPVTNTGGTASHYSFINTEHPLHHFPFKNPKETPKLSHADDISFGEKHNPSDNAFKYDPSEAKCHKTLTEQ